MTPDPAQDDGILTPDELQFEDECVAELGENRYLVRPDRETAGEGSVADTAAITSDTADSNLTHTHLESALDQTHTNEANTVFECEDDAHQRLAAAAEPHGVDITLKTDGEIAHHRATSHDVREVFVGLLTWYANQLDDDMSPSEALQVMLAASDLEV